MLVTSMHAFEYVSIGSFTVARNAAPILTYAAETVMHKEPLTAFRVTMLIGLLSGSVIYEWGNVSSSVFGLFLVFINILVGTADRFAQKHLLSSDEMECSKSTLSFINNCVASLVLTASLLVIEPEKVESVLTWVNRSHKDLFILGTSCCIALVLSWTGLWAQQRTSATEFLVLGCLTKISLIAVGIVFYDDSSTSMSIIGMVVSSASGILFSFRHEVENKLSPDQKHEEHASLVYSKI